MFWGVSAWPRFKLDRSELGISCVVFNAVIAFFCIIKMNLWIIDGVDFTSEVLSISDRDLEVWHLRKLWVFTNLSIEVL